MAAIIYSELAASIADEELTKGAIIYLEKFRIYSAGQDFKEATSRVISSLFAVGKVAAEKGLDKATKQAALALASLTIISKKIVESAISDYESNLKESDRSLYLKSKKLYEQELEK